MAGVPPTTDAGVSDLGEVKDCFKDAAIFSNFFSRAASSRCSRALRSMPGASVVGA